MMVIFGVNLVPVSVYLVIPVDDVLMLVYLYVVCI